MDSLAPDRRIGPVSGGLADLIHAGVQRGDITGRSAEELGALVERAVPAEGAPMSRPLTTREQEILQMLALGKTGEQIAQRLVLSPETVQKHVHNAKRKIGAQTRAHMIALALKRGLIDG